MGKKIFISYKYGDTLVKALEKNTSSPTKVRDYIDIVQEKIGKEHINKGEKDGESLKDFTDDTIYSKLRDKIYDSTITIVFISKGMKDISKSEEEQWIPWEISYSLREKPRGGRVSGMNAVLAVVLPDENSKYDYFITYNDKCNSRTLYTSFLFNIMKKNMFNKKKPDTYPCNGNIIYQGYSSYIYSVKWDDFIEDINKYIDISLNICKNGHEYDIKKNIK